MNLFDVINDEQLLNLALTHVCERDEDKIDPVAEQICIFYAMKQLVDEDPNIDDEDEAIIAFDLPDEQVQKRYSEMVVEKIIEQLTAKGMVEVDFGHGNVGYEITDEGKEMLNGN